MTYYTIPLGSKDGAARKGRELPTKMECHRKTVGNSNKTRC